MIKTRIREVAQGRGITTAYQLQKATELPPSMAARLYKDDVEMIALRTLDTLCTVLECSPGELFVQTGAKKKGSGKGASGGGAK